MNTCCRVLCRILCIQAGEFSVGFYGYSLEIVLYDSLDTDSRVFCRILCLQIGECFLGFYGYRLESGL